MTDLSNAIPKRIAVTDAMLRIVADQGLDRLSVREVAAAARVSIGAVQHYFPTKDAMLSAAYEEVVARIRSRLRAVKIGSDPRQNLTVLLRELLPLDENRADECRIHLAFAARAATAPELAEIQRTSLAELHAAVAEAFTAAWHGHASRTACVTAAHAAIAAADGLALHAVSSDGWLLRRRQLATVDLVVDALMATQPTAAR